MGEETGNVITAGGANEPLKVAFLISGRGSNMRAVVEAARKHEMPVEFVLVLSDRESAAGLEFAKEAGIPVAVVGRRPKEQSRKEFTAEIVEVLRSNHAQFVILAGFMRVLDGAIVRAFKHRVINIHPSLLPAFPGLEAQQQALDAGVSFSGCTVHFVSAEVDAGPIIAQAVVPVLPGDDVETLSARILKHEHRLLPAVVNAIARGYLRCVADSNGERVMFDQEMRFCGESEHLISINPL